MSAAAGAGAVTGAGGGAGTGVVVATFVRLKLALLRNGVKQTTGRSAAFLGSVVLTVLVGGLGMLGLLAMRGHEHAADVGIALAATLALGWAFMPLFVSGIDETLDPGRLALLPLRPGPLMAAQLAAAVVGSGPLFTLLLAGGAVVATAHGAAGAAVAVLAAPLVLLVCAALSRALATANARLLASRRGRDLAILSGLLIGFGAQAVNLGFSQFSGSGDLGPIEATADVARWVPPASAVDAVRAAGEGSYGVAAAGLLGTLAALGLLLWWWHASLSKLMTSPDSSTLQPAPERGRERAGATAVRRVAGGLARWLPAGRAGTAMERSLRYAWRDPKAKMAWATALGMGLIMPVLLAAQGSASVYHSCWAATLLGLMMFNQFGQDYSAFWLVAQTIDSAGDAYQELRGRALAIVVIAVPYTAVVVLGTAALIGGWGELGSALGIAWALLGGMVGAGAVSSALCPYSIPQDSPMRNVAPGQGAVAYFSIIGGALVAALVCAPVFALAFWLHRQDSALVWAILPVGIGYGLALGRLGLRLAARPTVARLPEILAAVGRA